MTLKVEVYIFEVHQSCQTRSRPHTSFLPQKVASRKGNPLISRKSRLVKYDNLAPDQGVAGVLKIFV